MKKKLIVIAACLLSLSFAVSSSLVVGASSTNSEGLRASRPREGVAIFAPSQEELDKIELDLSNAYAYYFQDEPDVGPDDSCEKVQILNEIQDVLYDYIFSISNAPSPDCYPDWYGDVYIVGANCNSKSKLEVHIMLVKGREDEAQKKLRSALEPYADYIFYSYEEHSFKEYSHFSSDVVVPTLLDAGIALYTAGPSVYAGTSFCIDPKDFDAACVIIGDLVEEYGMSALVVTGGPVEFEAEMLE